MEGGQEIFAAPETLNELLTKLVVGESPHQMRDTLTPTVLKNRRPDIADDADERAESTAVPNVE